MRAALLVGLSAQASTTSVLEAQRVSFRVSGDVSAKFGRSGAVALRSVIPAPSAPLQRLGCPCTLEEFAGTARECRLAASLACALLRCDAVCDPVGEWGAGFTHAHDHYAYAHLLEEPKRSCVVVLPREPVTLTLRGHPATIVAPTPYSSSSHVAFFDSVDGAVEACGSTAQAPPPEPEICLDAGDALVLRGNGDEASGVTPELPRLHALHGFGLLRLVHLARRQASSCSSAARTSRWRGAHTTLWTVPPPRLPRGGTRECAPTSGA